MRCRIRRWELSRRLAAGEPLSEGLRRHLARCDACREHHDRLTALTGRLRDAAPPAEPLSPELTARILAAVRAERTPIRRAAPRSRIIRIAAPLAAAAGVLLAVGLYFTLTPGPTPDPNVSVVVTPPPAQLPPGPQGLTEPFWADVEQLAGRAVVDPIQHLADETESLGNSLLARLPLDLLRAGDGRWLDDLLPGAPGSQARPRAPTSHPARSAG